MLCFVENRSKQTRASLHLHRLLYHASLDRTGLAELSRLRQPLVRRKASMNIETQIDTKATTSDYFRRMLRHEGNLLRKIAARCVNQPSTCFQYGGHVWPNHRCAASDDRLLPLGCSVPCISQGLYVVGVYSGRFLHSNRLLSNGRRTRGRGRRREAVFAIGSHRFDSPSFSGRGSWTAGASLLPSYILSGLPTPPRSRNDEKGVLSNKGGEGAKRRPADNSSDADI